MMNKKFIIIALLLLIVFCIGFFMWLHQIKKSEIEKNQNQFVNYLSSPKEYIQFAGKPLDNSIANISSVKVVYDINRKKVFFINANLFKLHFDFCKQILGYPFDLAVFNISNYSNGFSRDYYLANLNCMKNTNQYFLEFTDVDEIDSINIVIMFEQVKQASYLKNNLQLLLNNNNTIQYFTNQKKIQPFQ
jgi:pyruvate, water dikinase